LPFFFAVFFAAFFFVAMLKLLLELTIGTALLPPVPGGSGNPTFGRSARAVEFFAVQVESGT
jgi:hypothetical protein